MDDAEEHMVIVGCGRVGAGLAARLLERGHGVAVVDVDPAAFARLRDLPVERVDGVGFDRATLVRAGIERATGLAAVTNGDNTNIVVARTAREAFGVERVVARIFDARRAAIYERLGIPTIASAQLTLELALRRLRPGEPDECWIDPSARVALIERPVEGVLIGRNAADLDRDGVLRIVAVRRLGVAVLATPRLVLQDGDVVYAAVDHDRRADAIALLGGSEETGG